jgi:hypothetical protein
MALLRRKWPALGILGATVAIVTAAVFLIYVKNQTPASTAARSPSAYFVADPTNRPGSSPPPEFGQTQGDRSVVSASTQGQVRMSKDVPPPLKSIVPTYPNAVVLSSLADTRHGHRYTIYFKSADAASAVEHFYATKVGAPWSAVDPFADGLLPGSRTERYVKRPVVTGAMTIDITPIRESAHIG